MGTAGRKRSGECRAPAKRSSWRCAKPAPERLCPHHSWRVRDVKALGREAAGNHSELSGLGKELQDWMLTGYSLASVWSLLSSPCSSPVPENCCTIGCRRHASCVFLFKGLPVKLILCLGGDVELCLMSHARRVKTLEALIDEYTLIVESEIWAFEVRGRMLRLMNNMSPEVHVLYA